MQGLLIASFLAFYAVISLTTSFPTKRSPQCQRNKAIRSLLQDALSLSHELAHRSSVLKQGVTKRWPTDPYQESNVDFFLPLRSLNETTLNKSSMILEGNCRTLRTFIALVDNSTNQLNRFPVARSLRGKLAQLKYQTRILMSCLRRIITIMKLQQKGQSDKGPARDGKQKTRSSPNTGSQTVEDVTFRTKLILDEFGIALDSLIADLWKIRIQTCN